MVFIVWAVLLLIASALLADAVKYYEDSHFCELLDRVDTKQQCEHLIVGTVGQKLIDIESIFQLTGFCLLISMRS